MSLRTGFPMTSTLAALDTEPTDGLIEIMRRE
jgi:hypothetical protein